MSWRNFTLEEAESAWWTAYVLSQGEKIDSSPGSRRAFMKLVDVGCEFSLLMAEKAECYTQNLS